VNLNGTSNSDAIRIRGLTKRFRTYRSNKRRVLSWLSGGRLGGGRWVDALSDLDLAVPRGESLAVVGANGAGKSTLLKLVSGTLHPTAGSVHCAGRVGALLELGMGFHPEFTGRENIRLNGLLLGMSPEELRRSTGAIIDFSELGEFIDEPIRTYSSGMVLRLGYSVAVFMDPAILAIDEALAVGDAAFQQKCYDHMRRFLHGGGTLLFVSHEPQAVLRICDRAVLLEKGRKVFEDSPANVLQEYSARLASGAAGAAGSGSLRFRTRDAGLRGGQFRAMIESVELGTKSGTGLTTFLTGSEVVCCVRGVVIYPVEDLTVGILIRDRTGADVYGTNSSEMGIEIPVGPGGAFEARFAFRLNLGAGQYTLSAALHAGVQHLAGNYDWADRIAAFEVVPDPSCRFTGSVWLPTELEVRATQPPRSEELAELWSRVLVDAPTRISPSSQSARFLLGGAVGGAGDDAFRLGAEAIVALRLDAGNIFLDLTNQAGTTRTVTAAVAATLLGDGELPAGRGTVRFEVPAAWRGKTALVRFQFGDGPLLCHGIGCE
jgi:lipopolysaccharide transport system ATP-binding protein